MEAVVQQAIEQVPALVVLSFISWLFVKSLLSIVKDQAEASAGRDRTIKAIADDFSRKSDQHEHAYTIILQDAIRAQVASANALEQHTDALEQHTKVVIDLHKAVRREINGERS